MAAKLLLIGDSVIHGRSYLDHCRYEISDILEDAGDILFVPYARPGGRTWDGSTKLPREIFEDMGFRLNSIHEYDSPVEAVKDAEAIFIGGGNTFVLLNSLYEQGLIEAIRERVKGGLPYIGASAGANVAGPTIMTTNDMPIIEPPSFEAIGLVPFLVNCHYLDKYQFQFPGESRDERIEEYHAFHDEDVIALKNGAMLIIVDDEVQLKGSGAKVFGKGKEPKEYRPGDLLDFL